MELTNEFRVGIPVEQCWGVLTDVERIAPCMPGAELREVEGEEYRGVVKVKVGPVTAEYKGAAHFVEKDESAHRAVLSAEGRETRGQGNANATITAQLESDGDQATRVSVVTDLAVSGKVAQFGRGVLADVSAKLLTQFVDCLEATILGAGPEAPAEAPVKAPASSSPAKKAKPKSAPTATLETEATTEATTEAPPEELKGVAPKVAREETPEAIEATPQAAARIESNGVGHSGASASTNGNANGQAQPTPRNITMKSAEPVDLLDVAGASVAKRLIPALIAAVVLALGGGLVFRRWRS